MKPTGYFPLSSNTPSSGIFSWRGLAYLTVSLAALLAPLSAARAGTNLLANPGFEDGAASWETFIPPDSEGKGCEFVVSNDAPHTGKSCAEMKTADFARFAIYPKLAQDDPLKPGDRVHLAFWVKAAKSAQFQSKSGVNVRIMLADEQGKNLPFVPAVFIGLNGHPSIHSVDKPAASANMGDDVPTVWTKVESVFEVPTGEGAVRISSPTFFVTGASGSVFLDDFILERAGAGTPLSPLAKP